LISTNKYFKKFFSLAGLTLMLSGCGGGNGNGQPAAIPTVPAPVSVLSGQFIDAVVAGIGYRTATQSGVTDSNGRYNYLEGEQVTFFIGDLAFPPVTAKGIVTPLDIALEGDTTAIITDDMVINVARFLQSLDTDNDLDNGITISADLNPANSIDFAADAATFAAAFQAEFATTPLIDANTAKNHLQSVLNEMSGTGVTSYSIFGRINNDTGVEGTWTLLVNGSNLAAEGSLITASLVSFNNDLIDDGSSFEITTNNSQCEVSNGTGTIASADIRNVAITCTAVVTANHLVTGSIVNDANVTGQWELFVNGTLANDGSLTTNSSVGYSATPLADGSTYEVKVSNNACVVDNASGTIAGSNVTNVAINCTGTPATFQIRGSITGNDVTGDWNLLVGGSGTNSGALTPSSAVTFSMSAGIVTGSQYEITVENTACTVSNGAGSLSADVTNVLINCLEQTNGRNGVTTAATINPNLVGDYTMVYAQSVAGGPFTDGAEVVVNVGSDGSLTIDGTSYSDGFNRSLGTEPHLPEIIWLDSSSNIEFALSDNQQGSFNEINVGDACKPAGFGLPLFLGQLRVKVIQPTPAELVGIYAGSYSFVMTQAGSGYSAGDTLDFSIDVDGSISYVSEGSSVAISASAVTYEVFDQRPSTTISPGIQVSHRVPDQTDGTFQYVTLYLEGDSVVAISLDGFKGTAELRPLPQEVVDMMDILIAASPVELRVTKDDSTYSGAIIGRDSLCQSISLEITDPADSTSSISELRLGFYLYERKDWRYNVDAVTGIRSLGRNGVQINLHPNGEISLGEGFVDFGTLVMSNPKDFATNEQAPIDANCADFQPLLVNTSVPQDSSLQGTNGNIEVVNSATSVVVSKYPENTSLQLRPGESDSRTIYLADGTEYLVRYTEFSGLYSTIFCSVDNGSGTISSTNLDVSIICSAQPSAGTFTISGVMDRELSGTLTLGDGTSSRFSADIVGATDTYLLQGLPDGTAFSIDAKQGFSACLSAPLTGTVSGENQTIDIVCDL